MDSDIIISPDTQRKNRVPPGQRLTDRWPVLHYGPVPRFDPAKWSFRIWGLLNPERVLSYAEFTALPRVKVSSDIHCVTTWSRLDNLWEGVSTAAVKDLTALLPEARFVIVHAAGGFTTNLTLEDFFQPDVLFAMQHDPRRSGTEYGLQPITPEHGGPVRLVVPRLYFWKSAKWVTGIQFTTKDMPGFWETRGYHNHGDPWTEERYG
jgi:DMSO/TMAO reductase YedYZ molybdopterin-dependent catalytic subunit